MLTSVIYTPDRVFVTQGEFSAGQPFLDVREWFSEYECAGLSQRLCTAFTRLVVFVTPTCRPKV